MPKKIKKCFYEKLTFENLLAAHQRAKKNKTYKNEVILFELNLESNIINLLHSIQNGTYRLGTYKTFKIYEPKERIIKALPYIDRVVHQWYVEEFIKPYFIPRLISTTYACIEGRGMHSSANQLQEYLKEYQRNNPNFWILKCDVSKFFYSINPNILYSIMQKYIADKTLLNFTKLLIYDKSMSYDQVGIPIGNYTSQFFANIYLNELDQFLKRKMHIKYYIRYMDDFILLLPTKNECIKFKNIIGCFLSQKLSLHLNNKTKYYPNKMGVDFCGYRIFSTHRLLRLSSKKKIKKSVVRWNKLYLRNRLPLEETMQSLNSWVAHASHCNSYNLRNKIINSCIFLVNTCSDLKKEQELINLIEASKRQ